MSRHLVSIVGSALRKATDGSAGYELIVQETIDLVPGQQALIKTGVFTAFHKGMVAIIKEKSGNSLNKKIRVHAGVIDSDYRKEWGVVVTNGSIDLLILEQGKAIAQVLFVELPEITFDVVDSVDDLLVSTRDGGFGSTKMGIG